MVTAAKRDEPVVAKKSTTKKWTTKYTECYRRARTATKKVPNSVPVFEAPPRLSLNTWRLLHVKAVNDALDAGLVEVGVEHIKRKVLEFVGFAPSGVKLVTNYENGHTALLDGGSGVAETKWQPGGLVEAMAWNPSGTKLAEAFRDAGSHDAMYRQGILQIRDTATGKIHVAVEHRRDAGVEEVESHSTGVFAVAWNDTGTKVATVSYSHASGAHHDRCSAYLTVFDAADGTLERRVPLGGPPALLDVDPHDGFRDMVMGWSPCGTKIAASCKRRVYFVDAVRGVVEREVRNEMGVRAAAWNSSWTKLAISTYPFESYPRICIEHMASGLVEHEIVYEDPIRAVSWDPAGSRLVTLSADMHLRVIDAMSGKVELDVAFMAFLLAAVWSPCGQKLAVTCASYNGMYLYGQFRIINAMTGEVEHELTENRCWYSYPPSKKMGEAAWCPSGRKLAIGGLDGVTRIVNTASGVVERSIQLDDCRVRQVAWNP